MATDTNQNGTKYTVRNTKTNRLMRDAITGRTMIFDSIEHAEKMAATAYIYEFLRKGRSGRRIVEAV